MSFKYYYPSLFIGIQTNLMDQGAAFSDVLDKTSDAFKYASVQLIGGLCQNTYCGWKGFK